MKLSPLAIYVVGICIVFAAVMVSLSIFLPNIEEAKNFNTRANEYIEQAEKQPLANKKVEQAIADVTKMGEDWQKVVAVKTPPSSLPNGINLAVNRWQLTNDSVQSHCGASDPFASRKRFSNHRVLQLPFNQVSGVDF